MKPRPRKSGEIVRAPDPPRGTPGSGNAGGPGPQGPPGNDGADGAQGSQGLQGIQGPPGNDGADGAQGSQGLQGIQGPPGNDGADGAQGPQGLQGIQGPPGNDGADGAQGPQGLQGIQGPPANERADGAQGPQGLQGIQGPPGNDGADGAQGPQGLQGIQGPPGNDGADGAQGPAGPGGDVVYVGVGADTAVNVVADATVVTRDVAGVAAGDKLIVDAWFTILNNSGATRVYTVTVDFDGLFDVEFATGACATSATLMHPFRVQAVCDIRATNLAYMMAFIDGQLAAGIAAGADTTMAATHLEAKGWGTSASNGTGALTVALKIRSANTAATQTLRLHYFTIRKVTPA